MSEPSRFNVASYLSAAAARGPDRLAIVAPRNGGWRRITYAELDRRTDAIAHGLAAQGVTRGELTLVMVRAGIELIEMTYALFKAGAVPVLIDPGMGRRAFLRCVADTRPTAFVGIPLAHVLRLVFAGPFQSVKRVVTAGPRLFWGGAALAALEREGGRRGRFALAETDLDETAAVLFTSGSTGPAKGAVYTHGIFRAQVEALRRTYGFTAGEVDLAAFPLFSLFDCAFEMTSVIPELDPSRPGSCDPAKVVVAIREHGATSAFGSPAIWKRVAPWCQERGVRLPQLRRVLMAGAPVPPALVAEMREALGPEGDVHTPYGATEALPVASIAGREVSETAARSRAGGGTCVGPPVEGMDVRVIRVSDGPIGEWSESLCLGEGEVGEICVKGPVVTRAYHNRPEADAAAKIRDDAGVWHRMGDLGYRDAQGRLWFCGRKAERVETARGPLYTDQIEGMAGADARVARCALVGVGGGASGGQRPVLVVEGKADPLLAEDLRRRLPVEAVLFHPRFPLDVRHNAKIHRRTLAAWAQTQLRA